MVKLTGICLISDDVPRLRRFYESVLQAAAKGDDQFCYFGTDTLQLSIFPTAEMEILAPGSTRGSGTGRAVFELGVEDVDAEHARLVALGVEVVKPPATHDWGLRAAWFRDPDGNVVDLYMPAAT